MRELLPDAWHSDNQSSSCCKSSRPRHGGLVTDILLWTEGYASLVAVLSTQHPSKTPQFMAYLRSIVHVSRNFEGAAWASYDAAYCRQAATTGSMDWGTIDAALYCEAFTGKAQVLPRCRFCLSDTHASQECHYAPTDNAPPQPKVPCGPMTAVGNRQPRLTSGSGVELCGLFNKVEGNQCRYRFCRYAHICRKCRAGPHPATDCGKQLASTRPSCSSSATDCPLSPRCWTGRPASTQQ